MNFLVNKTVSVINRLDGKARAGMAFKFLALCLVLLPTGNWSYGYSSNFTLPAAGWSKGKQLIQVV